MQLEKQLPKVCPVNTEDMQLRSEAIISVVSIEMVCICTFYNTEGAAWVSSWSLDIKYQWPDSNVTKFFNEIAKKWNF